MVWFCFITGQCEQERLNAQSTVHRTNLVKINDKSLNMAVYFPEHSKDMCTV